MEMHPQDGPATNKQILQSAKQFQLLIVNNRQRDSRHISTSCKEYYEDYFQIINR